MGVWKNRSMEQEAEYEWAKSVLLEAGALQECEAHGTVFEGSEEVTEAYKLVNARITSGEIKLKEGQSRRDITNLVKAVYDDNSAASKCPICEKNFGPD